MKTFKISEADSIIWKQSKIENMRLNYFWKRRMEAKTTQKGNCMNLTDLSANGRDIKNRHNPVHKRDMW